jgi:membrane-bound inhibitor of C-type lysozyme
MRRTVIFAVMAVVLAACQTPCIPQTPASTTANYRCEDGSHLTVTFTHAPERVHIEQEGYAPIDLPSRITGSGYRYADNGAELRGRAEQARWQRPGAAETQCNLTQ